MLGLAGWYSTNILGNRDGEVLDDPDSFKTKEESKLGVLEHILQPETFPALYGDIFHKVRINYYPPRGDNKEGWDNIDIFGWLGYPMQIKVDFLCRDSILAAPLALDLVLFTDLAQRAGLGGIQEWLSFYYKSPMAAPGLLAEDDLFIQLTKLKNTLRWIMGEDQITHLGREYYATRRLTVECSPVGTAHEALGSGNTRPEQSWILHVDLDQFLAAVEVLRRPELAGRPVVVGGDGDPDRPRQVVATASYEARAFGVRSGMPLAQARAAVPGRRVPAVGPRRLRRRVGRGDGDAALVRRPGRGVGLGRGLRRRRRTDDPEALAAALKARVLDRTRLSCAVGIGETKLQAKTATGFAKPGGIARLTRATWIDDHGRAARSRPSGASAPAPRRASASSASAPSRTWPAPTTTSWPVTSARRSDRTCGCSASAATTRRSSTSRGSPGRAARRRRSRCDVVGTGRHRRPRRAAWPPRSRPRSSPPDVASPTSRSRCARRRSGPARRSPSCRTARRPTPPRSSARPRSSSPLRHPRPDPPARRAGHARAADSSVVMIGRPTCRGRQDPAQVTDPAQRGPASADRPPAPRRPGRRRRWRRTG